VFNGPSFARLGRIYFATFALGTASCDRERPSLEERVWASYSARTPASASVPPAGVLSTEKGQVSEATDPPIVEVTLAKPPAFRISRLDASALAKLVASQGWQITVRGNGPKDNPFVTVTGTNSDGLTAYVLARCASADQWDDLRDTQRFAGTAVYFEPPCSMSVGVNQAGSTTGIAKKSEALLRAILGARP
jgi:hypothetical protein